MNDNAKAWVAALRSGQYKQGWGCLREKDNSLCCLGVACELAVQAGIIEQPEFGEDMYRYAGLSGELPISVKDWLGLASERGAYVHAGPSGDITSLARKNDEGVPFGEIADIIESEPEGLFA